MDEICFKPGPRPPPVVGLAIPAASPITMTRSLNGRRIIPDGTGPQYRAVSVMLANRSFHNGWFNKSL